MQKILFIVLTLLFFLDSVGQTRNWDKPMQLKNCSIQVKADLFTATTFIELEFYNPNKQEIEGLYQFRLLPGQAITAFQLDLNGKYRDGSIEEKWKATNAYNTIVGKRIDPALLQMDYENNYSLRIYPLPPGGKRRVTMTIQEVLKVNKESLEYNLPLNFKDTVSNFSTNIKIYNSHDRPYATTGLVAYKNFTGDGQNRELNYDAKNILLRQPLSFHIPLRKHDSYCVKTTKGNSHFALRHASSIPKTYSIKPKNIVVYWDVSSSGSKRDINKEISFLKQYVAFYNVDHITISLFNYKIQQTVRFTANGPENKWVSFIKSLEYDGATQIGAIDLSNQNADAFFLFTDGYNSYGRSIPKGNINYLFTVHASAHTDKNNLNAIIGESGGRDIDLQKLTVSEAIMASGAAENLLLDIRSASGKTIVNVENHNKNNEFLVAGTLHGDVDTLLFHYGNNHKTFAIEKVYIDRSLQCNESAIERLQPLSQFNSIITGNNWKATLAFGRDQKMVTPNTSFIVLERVEDYVRFNIEPPVELEKECEEKGYVKKNKENDFRLLNKLSEQDILNSVIATYNAHNRRSGSNQDLMILSGPGINQPEQVDETIKATPGRTSTLNGAALGIDASSNLEEVVVVGYGVSKRKSITGAITTVRSNEIPSSATSIEQALSGRIAGLSITSTNSNFIGEASSIRIRGIASLNNEQPLFVLDGTPVSGNINDIVSVHDIDNITVLKNASATAVYGSRGANGVILIQTKRGKNNYNNYYDQRPYKLKDQEDVEYLHDIQEAGKAEKFTRYRELRNVYGNEPGFYLDMANHFFLLGYKTEALTIISNAAEVSSGNLLILKAMAFVLEKHKEYDEAIKIYEHILYSLPGEIKAYRDLALAFYQNKNYQKAVDLLYRGITRNFEEDEQAAKSVKLIMLNDLQGITAIHKNEVDLSNINNGILKTREIDLRIVLDGNFGNVVNEVTITEPGGAVSKPYGNKTKNGGYITGDYYNHSLNEYSIEKATHGKYKISVRYHSYNENSIPSYIKITSFRNFGLPNQTMEIENVIMNNQNGTIQIGEVRW